MTKERSEVQYSRHPSVAMGAKIVTNLRNRTGRTLDQWASVTQGEGPAERKERIAWLKAEHGLGTNYAKIIAAAADGEGRESYDTEAYLRVAQRYVDDLFAGPKEHLRPIYHRVVELALELGDDVTISPCKTYVPFYRRYQFALVRPATRGRVDLGLALGRMEASGRLVSTGGAAKGDRISHRLPLTGVAEVDAEVERWLQMAYEMGVETAEY